MPTLPRWPDAFPLAGRTLPVLLAAFLLAGLVGHDPWKTDDAVFIAIARGLADGGDWLLPRLAGERWLDAPPLYVWVAAIAGQVFSLGGLLAWHDAARLATFAFLAPGLWALANASRRCHGEGAAWLAPLLAFGTLGLLVPSHDAQPAIIGFSTLAALLASLAVWDASPRAAPVMLSASLAVAFIGIGLDGILPLAAITMFAAAHPHWRRQAKSRWLLAVVLSIALLAIWPVALAIARPGGFDAWWRHEVTGLAGGGLLVFFRIEQFAWASWPAFPLALWTVWLERRRLGQWNVYLPLVATLVALAHYLHAREPSVALMPLLAALVFFAANGAGRLRRGAANAFDWFGAMTLTLFMALVWLGGVAILTGLPERVAKNFSKPAPGFVPEWSWPALAIAVIVTLAWLRLLAAAPKSPWRAASRWSLGVGALWVLLACLWLPWIDYGKSYRPVSADFRQALGEDHGCIERVNLGPAQRASLDYFDHIRTVPAGNACNLRIVQSKPQAPTAIPGWRLILTSARPGDRGESLRLYRRAP